ncbi:MAG: hypothetical protein QOD88_4477 [Mycobacterium sp.]|jgi:hypothetical protein|nr:hypothetical protein [Pseudonocardiales bacterium]MDT5321955.1 hypothetical protein [Mycobacterium sp.]
MQWMSGKADTAALRHYGANEGGITLNATLNHQIVLAEAHSPQLETPAQVLEALNDKPPCDDVGLASVAAVWVVRLSGRAVRARRRGLPAQRAGRVKPTAESSQVMVHPSTVSVALM